MSTQAKVLVIGLDGADPNVLYELVKRENLPTLRSLIQEGVSGRLKSTIPPSTCPAWVSSVTGVNMGKHGIHDFFLSIDLERKKITFADSTKRNAKAIWNIASKFDKKCVILNVPVTYPVERINGIMVSGMLTPSLKSDFTYPRNLKDELIDLGYEIDIGETMMEKLFFHERNEVGMLSKIKELIGKRTLVAEHLLREFDWDVFMVVYVALDRVYHLYWKYIDPKHVAYNSAEAKVIYSHILGIHIELDRAIARLLKAAGRNVNVVIYSDHGFRPLNKVLFTNNLFRKIGLLKVRRASTNNIITQEMILKSTLRLHLESLISKLPAKMIRRFGNLIQPSKEFVDIFEVDPVETKVFHFGYNYIRVNAKSISKTEKDRVKKQVLDLFNHKLSKLLIEAYRREDLCDGPMLKEIPDIILHSKGDVTPRALIPVDGRTVMEYDERSRVPSLMWNGDHGLYGVVIVAGPNVRNNRQTVRNANIIDIAPTILRFLNIPILSYMDGKPLIR